MLYEFVELAESTRTEGVPISCESRRPRCPLAPSPFHRLCVPCGCGADVTNFWNFFDWGRIALVFYQASIRLQMQNDDSRRFSLTDTSAETSNLPCELEIAQSAAPDLTEFLSPTSEISSIWRASQA